MDPQITVILTPDVLTTDIHRFTQIPEPEFSFGFPENPSSHNQWESVFIRG
jgi:hypothetical protein